MSDRRHSEEGVDHFSKKPLIFLSYKWNESKEDVWKFAEYLESTNRFSIWLDKQEMYANKLERMEEGIKGASVVVIFFNDDYQDSVDCRTEAEAAYRHRKKKLFVKMQPNEKPVQNWFAPIIGNNIYVDYYQNAKPELEILAHIEKLLFSEAIGQSENSNKSQFKIEWSRDIPSISSYVGRPSEETMLQDAFFEISMQQSTGGMLIYGEGGIGKTMLIAKAIALNEDFLRRCGISFVIWLNVFQLSQQKVSKLFDLIADHINVKFSQERGDAQDRLKDYFKTIKPCKILLVLDDLFNDSILQSAFRLGDNVRCIAISRRRDVIGPSCDRFLSQTIEIPTLSNEAVGRIFSNGKSDLKIDEKIISRIAEMCSGLPLLASVIKAKIRRFSNKRQIETFARKLSSSYSQVLISESWDESDKKRETISELLLCGFENESSEFRRRFYAFLVFKEAANVAVEDLAILWQCDIDDAVEYCSEFYNMSLLRSTSSEFDTFNVHALLYAAVLEFATNKDQSFNASIMNSIRETLLADINSDNDENILHLCLGQQRLLLIAIAKNVLENSPDLLFKMCSKQDKKFRSTPLHLLANKSVQQWCSDYKKSSYGLAAVCELANMMLTADEEKAKVVLQLKDDYSRQSVLELLVATVKDGCKWYCNALHLSASKGYNKLMSILMHSGANPETKDEFEQTPLRTAYEFGQMPTVEFLVSWGKTDETAHFQPVNVNAYDRNYSTVMSMAILNGHRDAVELMLKNGAYANYELNNGIDSSYCSTITQAIYHNHLEIADLLFSYDAKLSDPDLAVLFQLLKSETVKIASTSSLNALLAKWKRMPDDIDVFIENSFTTAVGMNHLVRAIHMSKSFIADNQFNDSEVKCLADAVFRSSYEAVIKSFETNELFLGKQKLMALNVAAFFNNVQLLELFIENGAPLNGNGADCPCPIFVASSNKCLEVVKVLLSKGVDINLHGPYNTTPLTGAAFSGQGDIVKLLLEHGANPNINNVHNTTPLMLAAWGGHKAVVEALIAHKADVNTSDYPDRSPLMMAALGGQEDIARLLLQAGADVHAVNKHGSTAAKVAELSGHESVAKLIKQYAD